MKIALVCSHGGHLTEMLEMLPAFADQNLFWATYRSTRAEELRSQHRVYTIENIGTSPFRLLATVPRAWSILRRERPDVLVSTGSEIAIPFFLLAKVLRIRSVFVESFCRVRSASATGRILYPLADAFFVQWPQTQAVYGPKARFEGGLL